MCMHWMGCQAALLHMQCKWCLTSGNLVTCSSATSLTSCCHIFEQLEIACGAVVICLSVCIFLSRLLRREIISRRLKIRMSIITIVLIFPVPVPPQGILAKRKYSQHIFAPHRLKKNRILSYALILVTSRMPVKDLGRCQMTESLKHSLNSGL